MEKLNKKTLLIISGIVLAGIAIILLVVFSIRPWESPMERAIRKETQLTNFEIIDTIIEDSPWYLLEVETADNNNSSTTLIILKRNDDGYNVVLGPTTDTFSLDSLLDNDVSDSIISYFHKDKVLWYNFSEFSNSYSSLVSSNTKLMIEEFAKDSGIELRRVYLIKDSLTSRTENERSEHMVQYANFQFSLNYLDDSNYYTASVIFSSSDISGRIYDNSDTIIAKKTYVNGDE